MNQYNKLENNKYTRMRMIRSDICWLKINGNKKYDYYFCDRSQHKDRSSVYKPTPFATVCYKYKTIYQYIDNNIQKNQKLKKGMKVKKNRFNN